MVALSNNGVNIRIILQAKGLTKRLLITANDDSNAVDTYDNLCEYLHGSDPTDGKRYAYPIFTNCVFGRNEGTYGGAMYNSNSSPVVTNCSFAGNIATTGGAIYNADVNCVPSQWR